MPMKAWVVKPRSEGYSTIVFAETRGKAKAIAMQTFVCDGCEFTKIACYRLKKADKYYRGRDEIDWSDPKDRVILVEQFGCVCEEIEESECEMCSASDICEAWKIHLKEVEEDAEIH